MPRDKKRGITRDANPKPQKRAWEHDSMIFDSIRTEIGDSLDYIKSDKVATTKWGQFRSKHINCFIRNGRLELEEDDSPGKMTVEVGVITELDRALCDMYDTPIEVNSFLSLETTSFKQLENALAALQGMYLKYKMENIGELCDAMVKLATRVKFSRDYIATLFKTPLRYTWKSTGELYVAPEKLSEIEVEYRMVTTGTIKYVSIGGYTYTLDEQKVSATRSDGTKFVRVLKEVELSDVLEESEIEELEKGFENINDIAKRHGMRLRIE